MSFSGIDRAAVIAAGVLIFSGMSVNADAGGIFDAIGAATNTINQMTGTFGEVKGALGMSRPSDHHATGADTSGDQPNSSGSVTSDGDDSGGLRWLQDPPRSKLRQTYYNPFESVRMPLSFPNSNGAARYHVTVVGKVSVRAYADRADDSPQQILKYYDAAFAQQGFSRVILCYSTPCSSDGFGENNYSDALQILRDGNFSPDDLPAYPLVMIAYRNDAVAVVDVGTTSNQDNAPAVESFVKLVEGKIKDLDDMKRWLASLNPSPLPVPSTSAVIVGKSRP